VASARVVAESKFRILGSSDVKIAGLL